MTVVNQRLRSERGRVSDIAMLQQLHVYSNLKECRFCPLDTSVERERQRAYNCDMPIRLNHAAIILGMATVLVFAKYNLARLMVTPLSSIALRNYQ
jgi:uncharacterized Fe-S radical SAM superfamily protein PflX